MQKGVQPLYFREPHVICQRVWSPLERSLIIRFRFCDMYNVSNQLRGRLIGYMVPVNQLPVRRKSSDNTVSNCGVCSWQCFALVRADSLLYVTSTQCISVKEHWAEFLSCILREIAQLFSVMCSVCLELYIHLTLGLLWTKRLTNGDRYYKKLRHAMIDSWFDIIYMFSPEGWPEC
jgi:hypothetical protein